MWHVVDARNQVLGRLTTQVARLLMGKHKPTYTPSVDCGDYVIVKNASEVALTGKKRTSKLYQWHTGWMGGLKTLTARQMFERDSRRVISLAVKGMLPRNPIRDTRLGRLRVFPGEEHDHAAQAAQSLEYAPEHLAAVAPRSVPPREKVAGGALVKDAATELTPEELKSVEASLVKLEHDPAFAKRYDEWRMQRVRQQQLVQEEEDYKIIAAIKELEAQEAAAAAAKGKAGGGAAAGTAPPGKQLK